VETVDKEVRNLVANEDTNNPIKSIKADWESEEKEDESGLMRCTSSRTGIVWMAFLDRRRGTSAPSTPQNMYSDLKHKPRANSANSFDEKIKPNSRPYSPGSRYKRWRGRLDGVRHEIEDEIKDCLIM